GWRGRPLQPSARARPEPAASTTAPTALGLAEAADDDVDRAARVAALTGARALAEDPPVLARVVDDLLADVGDEAGALDLADRVLLAQALDRRDGDLRGAGRDDDRDRRAGLELGPGAGVGADDAAGLDVRGRLRLDVDGEPGALERRSGLALRLAGDVGDGDRARAAGHLDGHRGARGHLLPGWWVLLDDPALLDLVALDLDLLAEEQAGGAEGLAGLGDRHAPHVGHGHRLGAAADRERDRRADLGLLAGRRVLADDLVGRLVGALVGRGHLEAGLRDRLGGGVDRLAHDVGHRRRLGLGAGAGEVDGQQHEQAGQQQEQEDERDEEALRALGLLVLVVVVLVVVVVVLVGLVAHRARHQRRLVVGGGGHRL